MTTERDPLLRGSSEEQYYTKSGIDVKHLDEEHASSSSSDEEEHDAEYIVKNRLGDTTLTMVALCLCIGSFLAAMDTSIITTIFNEIGTEFQSSNLSVWIMTSYMLSTSALQPLYGKLSDIFGRKSTLVIILTFFLVGSLLCGTAQTMVQMSIARAIAGLGGGGLMTMASVVIHDLVPMRNRGQYQGYVNMAQTVGTTIGAPIGGLINDTFGWRYCFYLNIPPCLFILYVYIKKLENYNLKINTKAFDDISQKLEKIDFIGAGFLLIANVSFVTGASLGGNTRPWSDPVIISLLASAVIFFIVFGLFEFNWAKNPLISRTLIKNRNVMSVCLNNFFICNSTMAFGYLIPQYFMGVLGYNASSAGLWVLPRTAMVATGCWIAGRYLQSTGTYKNFVVSLMGLHIMSSIGTFAWTAKTAVWFQLICMTTEGFVFGSVFVATMVALVADISHSETASATSMIFLCRSTGWLSGSTLTAAILQANFKAGLQKAITGPEAAEIIEFVRTSVSKIRTLAPEVQVLVIGSLEKAIHIAMFYGVVASILCFTVTLYMRNCHLGPPKK